ncbi:Cof-type HAD-IIB family hydrolase [Halalkalibacter akibai]|uniref:Haloacid dehalogenase-like hydrolase n=1 Tax=Halalkalibacter akibai (strain ATCC 43226 / DSM 21942 / CIP 109018 / JCM 9157 / 1139) TaxID=1236973 RepID=W4QUY5_HALA3|nr:Cof-type HAD-IIB family hydrolase [Halalkalibacter akibai]GAE35408.1 haloacid dehalogenase-like hydrolase [Halalkalibacter akibai JCM 9157]
MGEQHLIALDLDGTLLSDEKTISKRNKEAIAKARENGHIVCISTGRPYRASNQYYQELNLNTPIVNFNGAFVHHPLDQSFGIHHSPLDLKTAKTVIETCEAFNVSNIMVEIIDDFYLRHLDEVLVNTFSAGQSPVEHGNLLHILKEDPTCVLIHPQDHHVNQLRELLVDAHAEVIDQRVWGAPWNMIEIVKAGMNKAVGLQKVADFYNIPKERVIAFGDEDNDFEMIEWAGQGVAMANGIPQLKQLANSITFSNEEDGIAVYLEDALNLK